MGLAHPIANKALDRARGDGVTIGACEMHGFRATMEDEHVIVPSLPRHPSVAFFAVLDGHSGDGAARHFARELVAAIDGLASLDPASVRRCIVDTDRAFLERAAIEGDASGSTLVFALIERRSPARGSAFRASAPTGSIDDDTPREWLSARDARFLDEVGRPSHSLVRGASDGVDEAESSERRKGDGATDAEAGNDFAVMVGCTGDSRCIWGRSDRPDAFVQVTEDHRPSLRRESERVRAAGGCIDYDRVDGQLAVTRALGDRDMKLVPKCHTPMGQPRAIAEPGGQKVIAAPDLFVLDVSRGHYLLLACDGVFESLSTEEVARFIGSHPERDAALLCADLLDLALQRGSKDNMTGILVRFLAGTDGDADDAGCAAAQPRREYAWDRFEHWNHHDEQQRWAYEKNMTRYGFTAERVRRMVEGGDADTALPTGRAEK